MIGSNIWLTRLEADPSLGNTLHRTPQRNLEPTDKHGLVREPKTIQGTNTPIHTPRRLPTITCRQVPTLARSDSELSRKIAVSLFVLVSREAPRTGLVKTRNDVDGVVTNDPTEILLCEMVPSRCVARCLLEEKSRVSDVVALGTLREDEEGTFIR
jgi:hypothetical protein